MSDPKRWLADDPSFLASLRDLDRGLAGERQPADDNDRAGVASPAIVLRSALAREMAGPSVPPVVLAADARTAPPRVSRPIDAARALDPARVLDTSPRLRVAPSPVPAAPTARAASLLPPLALARPSPGEPRRSHPLLDLFPASALAPGGPPGSALGRAVGPSLPRPRPHAAAKPAGDRPPQLDGRTYETFYGLHECPFSLSTDPRFHYQSGSHERAGQEILAAIRTRGGPAVLTAPLGMGKTTLCRSLLAEIDRRTVTSLVLDPIQSIDDLLKTLLVDFAVVGGDDLARAPHITREMLAGALSTFLESLARVDAAAVLIIDEAQNVPVALLSDLAVLMDPPAARVLQLVLVGQPALTNVLKHGGVRALDASVSRRTELGPLAADEVASYVMHRLSIAGANTRVEFDEAAIARLAAFSEGSPRVVNLLCDRALTRGHQASAAVIDAALVDRAAQDLDLDARPRDQRSLFGVLLIAAAFAFLVLIGAAGAVWVSSDAVSRTIEQWEQVPSPPGGPVRRLSMPLAPIPPDGAQ